MLRRFVDAGLANRIVVIMFVIILAVVGGASLWR
jgi:hypothetical protein